MRIILPGLPKTKPVCREGTKVQVNYEFFSPWIVATTLRECFEVLNSRYHIPCQVPVATLPFEMGTVTLAPIKADLI